MTPNGQNSRKTPPRDPKTLYDPPRTIFELPMSPRRARRPPLVILEERRENGSAARHQTRCWVVRPRCLNRHFTARVGRNWAWLRRRHGNVRKEDARLARAGCVRRLLPLPLAQALVEALALNGGLVFGCGAVRLLRQARAHLHAHLARARAVALPLTSRFGISQTVWYKRWWAVHQVQLQQ